MAQINSVKLAFHVALFAGRRLPKYPERAWGKAVHIFKFLKNNYLHDRLKIGTPLAKTLDRRFYRPSDKELDFHDDGR